MTDWEQHLEKLRKIISDSKKLANKKFDQFSSEVLQSLYDLQFCFRELEWVHEADFGEEFTECRIILSRRVLSLLRLYEVLNSRVPHALINIQEAAIWAEEGEEGGTGEMVDYLEEDINDDQTFLFNNVIPMTIVVNLVSAIETFLDATVKCVSDIAEPNGTMDGRKYDNINFHIQTLKKLYGIPIKLDKSTNKHLDNMREFRNQFLHELGRDLPDQVQKVLKELYGSTELKDCNSMFVLHAFEATLEIVKMISDHFKPWREKQLTI